MQACNAPEWTTKNHFFFIISLGRAPATRQITLPHLMFSKQDFALLLAMCNTYHCVIMLNKLK